LSANEAYEIGHTLIRSGL